MHAFSQADLQPVAIEAAERLPRRWEFGVAVGVGLLVFVVVRWFGADRWWDLSGDQLTYLVLGRRFPFHRLYGDSLYLIHPPAWGWVIGVAWRVLGVTGVSLPVAGVVATQVFTACVFGVVWRYGRWNGLGPVGVGVALLYLALSTVSLVSQAYVSRFPILIAGMGGTIWLFERALREGWAGWRRWAVLGLAGGTMLVSDQAMLLVPCLGWVFGMEWVRGGIRGGEESGSSLRSEPGVRGKWALLGMVLGVCVVCGAVWPGVRGWVYGQHETYPAGIDGQIETVRPVPWRGVLQPNLLPETAGHNEVVGRTGVRGLEWERVVEYPTRMALPGGKVLWEILVGGLLAAGVFRGARVRVAWDEVWVRWDRAEMVRTVKLLGLAAGLYGPAAVGLYPWYASPFLVPFAVLIGRGADVVAGWRTGVRRWALGGLAVGSVAVCAAWLAGAYEAKDLFTHAMPGRVWVYGRARGSPGETLGPVLEELHAGEAGRAVMAAGGLVEGIVYATGRKTVGMPFEPGALEGQIRDYRVGYIVLPGSVINLHFGGPRFRKYSGQETVKEIVGRPERYRPVRVVGQRFPNGVEEGYVVFEVIGEQTGRG